jgi:hypothetical protein
VGRSGYTFAATAPRQQVDYGVDVGPAWWGSADWRLAACTKAILDKPTELGVHNAAPYVVPGAPPELRSLVAELVSSEQGRRDMLVRLELIEAGQIDPPHRGCRGTDPDLRRLATELLEATAEGADLRVVSWRWLHWAAFTAPNSCADTLAGLGAANLALARARQLLEALIEGEDTARERAGWAACLVTTDRALLQGPNHDHRMALWTLRHGLEVLPAMRPTSLAFAARCWVAQGGSPAEGLRHLATLLAAAPAWPVDVNA